MTEAKCRSYPIMITMVAGAITDSASDEWSVMFTIVKVADIGVGYTVAISGGAIVSSKIASKIVAIVPMEIILSAIANVARPIVITTLVLVVVIVARLTIKSAATAATSIAVVATVRL